jgi:hypothetical protein
MQLNSRHRKISVNCLVAAAALCLFIGLILCLASVPPVSRDALTHHLRVPQLYIDRGSMVELPEIEFSYYPMNIDMLYLVPLIWGNDIIPKYIHFSFALLTTVLLYRYLRKQLGTGYAYFGALFFLSLPIIVKLSITVYVDLGLIFFSTAAILQLLTWMEDTASKRHLVLAAICYGLALGVKYNGLVGFIILAGAIPFIVRYAPAKGGAGARLATGSGRPSSLVALLIFCCVSLAVFSPWMIRNLIWTGNPIYPLYDALFNPQPVTGGGGLTPFSLRHLVYKESFWQILLVPLRIFWEGQDNNPQLFDGKLSPFLLILPLVSFLGVGKEAAHVKHEKFFLLYFSLFTILFVFFKQDMRIRYIAPVIPALVILSARGLHQINACLIRWGAHPSPLKRGVLPVVAFVVVGFNLPYLYGQWRHVDPSSYLRGAVSRDQYIERHRPEYSLYRYANTRLGGDVKILGLFLGNRGYYCKRPIVYDIPGFKEILESAATAEDLTSRLTNKGISHLMINQGLFIPWSQQNLAPDARARMLTFLKNETQPLLQTNKGYVLLAINQAIS